MNAQATKNPDEQALDDILAEMEQSGEATPMPSLEGVSAVTSRGVNPAALADLKSSTPREEIKQRPTFRKVNGQRVRGPDLSYVDARYVMDRLDDVVGPENWTTTQHVLPDGSVVTTLSIRIDTGGESHWVSKSDVGVPSSIEPMKGAFSDSFKRAAVHWGIARDLYEEREEENAAPPQRAPIRERYADEDEDHVEDRPAPTRRPAPAARRSSSGYGQGRSNGGGNDARLREKQEMYDRFMEDWDIENSPWYCPDHDQVKVLVPGIGKQSGKPFGGKLVCPEPGCQEGGPWIEDILRERR